MPFDLLHEPSESVQEPGRETAWNVLTDRWLEVMNLTAEARTCSPMEALQGASGVHCIAAASPLDLFATHRFLLTLLYWKAGAGGGVQRVRDALLRGNVPQEVIDAIDAEAHRFHLFADEGPFLQDVSARATKEKDRKSAGSLFAEFACGTNIAHFHHGDDDSMRLCARCATIGMIRLVPWTQSGGPGLSPSVHNAPPVVAIASGENLAITLGLNLIPLPGEAGEAKWTGRFVPTEMDAAVPYLEAFTWNPRRIHLGSPQPAEVCWRCGRTDIVAVGRIVYAKNEGTKRRKDKGNKTIPFVWQDPSGFYAGDAPYTTKKSHDEALAARGRDLDFLLDEESRCNAGVVTGNVGHLGWSLVIPCTNAGNNKTFDHRQLELPCFSGDAVRSALPPDVPVGGLKGLDGWAEPRPSGPGSGAWRFVRSAARVLTNGDWAALSAAAYREMHELPAAFDVFSGLLWGLRGKVNGLPSKKVAWLVLKLMGAVPPGARAPRTGATFSPLRDAESRRFLPRRQPDERRQERSVASRYPVSFPRGRRVEAALRSDIARHLRQRTPKPIDWAGLCHGLDQLLD